MKLLSTQIKELMNDQKGMLDLDLINKMNYKFKNLLLKENLVVLEGFSQGFWQQTYIIDGLCLAKIRNKEEFWLNKIHQMFDEFKSKILLCLNPNENVSYKLWSIYSPQTNLYELKIELGLVKTIKYDPGDGVWNTPVILSFDHGFIFTNGSSNE